jgi:UDP-N-acetylglucosamine 1-carboxyvinyltransferase
LESYHIRGGNRICGEYSVKGSKNAALPILAAALLCDGECEITNAPQISDVNSMKKMLEELGCSITAKGGTLVIDSKNITADTISLERMKEMRSSVFLMGALLGRCGSAVLSQPGGCNIGSRPIDLHLLALRRLGVEICERDNLVICRGCRLKGANINFSFPSVGATENAMMAATAADGQTILSNCAREPEILDLQTFLNACGADISGAGTDIIHINGGRPLHGACHKIIPDRIECGTYMAAAVATRGEILISNAESRHLASILQKLKETGCTIRVERDKIYVKATMPLKALDRLITGPYPRFPTDLQSPFLTMLTMAEGSSLVEETIFENRFTFTSELIKMGADITIEENSALVRGVKRLNGTVIKATDLRGGAALTIAGLMAEGTTVIQNIEHIERGYANFPEALKSLGADIRKKDEG